VTQEQTPAGYPDAVRSCELLFLSDVPSQQIERVVLVDERGVASEESQLEHARFFAHLLANGHRLIGSLRDPHSTVWSPYGGWWTFDHVRRLLVDVSGEGAEAGADDVHNALRALASVGVAGVVGRGLGAESVRNRVTEAYVTAYLVATGNALDLTDDRPYAAAAAEKA
jgi:hypothetical protein